MIATPAASGQFRGISAHLESESLGLELEDEAEYLSYHIFGF
jgi:hypothetical protein